LYVYKRLLSPNSHLKDEDMESHSNPIMQLPRRIFNRPYWLITRDASKLASLLKNSSMIPSQLRSRAQRPVFAVFASCFESVCLPFWSMDRSDKDFFNRLLRFKHGDFGSGR
jgi:hypothetical protein